MKWTLLNRTRDGAGGAEIGSMNTEPVNQSAGPAFVPGRSRVIFIVVLLGSVFELVVVLMVTRFARHGGRRCR